MAHKRKEPYTIEELKEFIKKNEKAFRDRGFRFIVKWKSYYDEERFIFLNCKGFSSGLSSIYNDEIIKIDLKKSKIIFEGAMSTLLKEKKVGMLNPMILVVIVVLEQVEA